MLGNGRGHIKVGATSDDSSFEVDWLVTSPEFEWLCDVCSIDVSDVTNDCPGKKITASVCEGPVGERCSCVDYCLFCHIIRTSESLIAWARVLRSTALWADDSDVYGSERLGAVGCDSCPLPGCDNCIDSLTGTLDGDVVPLCR